MSARWRQRFQWQSGSSVLERQAWYQKAEYGDVWVPYLHVRLTPGERTAANDTGAGSAPKEATPFTI